MESKYCAQNDIDIYLNIVNYNILYISAPSHSGIYWQSLNLRAQAGLGNSSAAFSIIVNVMQ